MTHKQVVPTVDMLQASVRSMTARSLDVQDLARIKALCPDMVHLAYVPTAALRTERAGKRRRTRMDDRDDMYTPPARDENTHTLLFEFLDRDLATDKATSRRYVRSSKPSQEATVQLVSRRNATFTRAVQELLSACETTQDDPIELLKEASIAAVPKPPEETPSISSAPTRSSIAEILARLPDMSWWREQIVPGGRRTFPAREPKFGFVEPPLDSDIRDALAAAHGIQQLYTHQALALTHFQHGRHVVVSTGTSSGKSLVYQIPIMHVLATIPSATAMCIFPTKALTQDQLGSLRRLLHHHPSTLGVAVDAYDGDTPADYRRSIREQAGVLFTNPDMLHQAILPHEDRWRRFLQGLRVVVLDELHVYTGTFGTHVAFILRRLRRLCAAMGNHSIQFVSCSATIASPTEHMSLLLGIDTQQIELIADDGAPCGKKEWIVWNPPLIDLEEPGQGRVSSYKEVSQLFRHLVSHGIRTIVFAKVRRTCEIIIRQIREDFVHEGHAHLADRVHAYRSGYAPSDRRKLEHDMAHGHVLGLIATSALELGIDIGVLDAVILFGMPYTSASMWQQAGRAGRRQRDALVVLLGEPFPVDQYYMRHPELVFAPPLINLWVDPSNELLLEAHVQCAAYEMPWSSEDTKYFGERALSIVQRLCVRDQDGFYHLGKSDLISPATNIPIRGARQETYRYVDATSAQLLEEVEVERVYFEAYEGAVFLHQGATYVCQSVHHDARLVLLVRSHVLYHTRPRDLVDVDACETWRMRTLSHSSARACYGRVDIIFRVWGYFKVDRRANILDVVDIETAPLIRHTHGVWLDVPWKIVEALTSHEILASAAIHATEHAVLSLTPLFVASAADDVRTECKVPMRELSGRPTQRKRPSRLIFYDKPGQNAGVCTQVFEHLDALLCIALHVLETCECSDGCPRCIETPHCLHENQVSSKRGAMAVLRGLLHRPMFDVWDRCNELSATKDKNVLLHTLCAPNPVPQRDDARLEHIIEDPAPSHDMILLNEQNSAATKGRPYEQCSSLFFNES